MASRHVKPREVTPAIKWVTNFLLGRQLNRNTRYADDTVARTQPPPNLPDGITHKLASNYYYTRDGRHSIGPNVVVYSEQKKLISSGETPGDVKALPTPGALHHWD